jgi:hypothetical protein
MRFVVVGRNRHKFAGLRAGPDFGHLAWIEFTRPSQVESFLRDASRPLGAAT